MEGYRSPYSITEAMLNYVASISEKVGKINVYHNLDAKPHLRRNNRIKSIHSSLKIEANSLSVGEVKDVIDGRSVLGSEREIQEVKNAYEAYEMMDSLDPYKLSDLMKVHGVMTKMLQLESGSFRQGDEEEYYQAIANCHVNGNSDMLSEYVKKMLDIMDFKVPYSALSIMDLEEGNG